MAKPSGRVLVENANDRLPVNRRLSPIISQFIILSRLEYIVHGDTCLEDIAIMGIMGMRIYKRVEIKVNRNTSRKDLIDYFIIVS